MPNNDVSEYLKKLNLRNAVLVGQEGSGSKSATSSTGNTAAASSNAGTAATTSSNSGGVAGKWAQAINNKYGTNAVKTTTVTNPQTTYIYGTNGIGVPVLTSGNNSSSGNSGNSGGSSGTSTVVPDYQSTLNDLYNNVMGYGSYTPSTYTPTTYTAGVYTPSTYSRTVDTSGTEAMLAEALGDIRGYGDFKYDLNGDMLYQQALDNYMMLGNQAMVDATANAAALTGGYGNSYAASVGNQAYQNYITQANNMIPEFQQMALNTWQSGYDRLLNDYNAISQQLANLLNIENTNFSIWNANESNAANAFSMNEANRYNAWAQNEANAYNAWAQNEANNYNQWQANYGQAMDQYELAKDYYATLEAMKQYSGGSSSGSSTSSSSGNKTSSTIAKIPTVTTTTVPVVTNPLNTEEYLKYLASLRS